MLDEYNYRFIGNNEIIHLSKRETWLLELLISNKGKIVSHDEISDWIYGADGSTDENIRVLLWNLKQKIKKYVEIKTKNRKGYIIEGVVKR